MCIFLYIPTSVCVQYVHIYTVYSAAVPSFVVRLYSASNCFLFYRYCRSSTLNEEMINLNKMHLYIKTEQCGVFWSVANDASSQYMHTHVLILSILMFPCLQSYAIKDLDQDGQYGS